MKPFKKKDYSGIVKNELFEEFKTGDHRMELIRKDLGVNYINDSKSTSINEAWYALTSVVTPVVWIAGGATANRDYRPLLDHVSKVKALVCLGSNNTYLHEIFGKKILCIVNSTDMESAVLSAARLSFSLWALFFILSLCYNDRTY